MTMKLKTTLKGTSEKTFHDLSQTRKATARVIRQFWFLTGHDFRNEARAEILRKPKSGRVYFVRTKSGGKRRRHVASAPFETHANISGKVRGSIGFKIHGKTRMSYGYGISTAKPAPEWARFLEFGTIGFKKVGPMAARPSLSASIDKMEGRAQRNFDIAVAKEFSF